MYHEIQEICSLQCGTGKQYKSLCAESLKQYRTWNYGHCVDLAYIYRQHLNKELKMVLKNQDSLKAFVRILRGSKRQLRRELCSDEQQ